ncbi:MAG: c-type cytochrome [Bdellovibrionota bacterium]
MPAILISLVSCSHLQMGAFAFSTNPTADDPESIARGRTAFERNCLGCHGRDADGRGPDAEGLNAAPTDFTAKSYDKAAWRIAARISIGKGSDMPSFKDKLPEKTIWDLANYLHSLKQGQHTDAGASRS